MVLQLNLVFRQKPVFTTETSVFFLQIKSHLTITSSFYGYTLRLLQLKLQILKLKPGFQLEPEDLQLKLLYFGTKVSVFFHNLYLSFN